LVRGYGRPRAEGQKKEESRRRGEKVSRESGGLG